MWNISEMKLIGNAKISILSDMDLDRSIKWDHKSQILY